MWQHHLCGGKRNEVRLWMTMKKRLRVMAEDAQAGGGDCWGRSASPPSPLPHFLPVHQSVIPSSTSLTYSCCQFFTPAILGEQCDHGFIIHPHPAQLLEIKYHKRWKEHPTWYHINGICTPGTMWDLLWMLLFMLIKALPAAAIKYHH